MKHKKNLHLRALIIQAIRNYFINFDYLEVETPIRLPVFIPETYIEPVESELWYLQTSPELCMKRLLCAGYDKIFQICKCFRKNERGEKHLPEMTMLEWYRTKSTYQNIMEQCEMLVKFIGKAINCRDVLHYQGNTINIYAPWEKITVSQAFQQYTSITMLEAIKNGSFDEIMGIEIEPKLGFDTPVFLYDYPIEKGALAKRKSSDKSLVERFELYISGIELCNAFTELTDPVEQRIRFENEIILKKKDNISQSQIPEKFLKSLETMPDAAGIAFGIDRLVMLFANAETIDMVTTFTPEEL